jgi:hypothetical protein
MTHRAHRKISDSIAKAANGCWEWQGTIDALGYGSIRIGAHRYVYLLVHGSIPEDTVLDHLCRNTRCVNPEHLEPVTLGENMRRAWERRDKTKCPQGHFCDEENTYIREGSDGITRRWCRMCRREQSRRYQANKRAHVALEVKK